MTNFLVLERPLKREEFTINSCQKGYDVMDVNVEVLLQTRENIDRGWVQERILFLQEIHWIIHRHIV